MWVNAGHPANGWRDQAGPPTVSQKIGTEMERFYSRLCCVCNMRKQALGSWGCLCGVNMWNVWVYQSGNSPDGWTDGQGRRTKENTEWGKDKRSGSTASPEGKPGFLVSFNFRSLEKPGRFLPLGSLIHLLYLWIFIFISPFFIGSWLSCFLLLATRRILTETHQYIRGGRFPYLQIWGNNVYNHRDRVRIKPGAKCLPQHQAQKRILTKRSYCITISHRGAKLTLGDLDPSTQGCYQGEAQGRGEGRGLCS